MIIQMIAGDRHMMESQALAIESFLAEHPALNGLLLIEHARVALALHHDSPAIFLLLQDAKSLPAAVSFQNPDPRSAGSLEREDFVEKGAIVMAGILLALFKGQQITRVSRRGSRVDYFVGERVGDQRWILEVSGTDTGDLKQRREAKHAQLRQSPYLYPPYRKDGYVAVTRFAQPAVSVLDTVPSFQK